MLSLRLFPRAMVTPLVLVFTLSAIAQTSPVPVAPPPTITPPPALPTIDPAAAGFSADGIANLDAAYQALTDGGKISGIVTILARHGKIVDEKAHGDADLASAAPMKLDSIVRIYSMSKPITGVAMMMLYEQGKWKPTDPIAKFIPEFKDLKVYSGVDKDGKPLLEDPGHAPTMGELLSHSAGFTYGIFGGTPVDKMYMAVNPLGAPSLKEFIARVARLPLLYQPGQGWEYSISVDIQGYLVEQMSGESFPDFLREHIFEPLGMKDTGFSVPVEKLGRVATIYTHKDGALQPMGRDKNISQTPGLPSGGGGLYSTAEDYLRFAEMLANGGEGNGVRLLQPATVDLMHTNHVTDEVRAAHKFGIGGYIMRPGLGYGYDLAVFDDPAAVGSPVGKGTYFWNGIASTFFWVDPANDIIFVGMPQQWLLGGGPNVEQLARKLTYQALVDPKK